MDRIKRMGNTGRRPHYNGKDCFDAWLEAGSLKRAAKLLYKQGVTKANGDGPPIPASIQIAAKRYVLMNPEEAREKFISRGHERMAIDSEWAVHRILSAARVFGKGSKHFKNWLVYENLWEVAINIGLAKPYYDPGGQVRIKR
jgi:hypothetical protein